MFYEMMKVLQLYQNCKWNNSRLNGDKAAGTQNEWDLNLKISISFFVCERNVIQFVIWITDAAAGIGSLPAYTSTTLLCILASQD